MRVWELRDGFSPEHLRLAERPDPEPGPGQVLVRMAAASLNYRDTLVIRGGYGPRVTLPLVPVSDGAGVVERVGEGVADIGCGDRVAPLFFQDWQGGPPTPEKWFRTLGGPVDGALADYMCVAASGVARVPPHLSDPEAACLPCAGLTAWSAVNGSDGEAGGGVRAGDTVLVQGTGGVALFALQFAKLAGARVILTSSDDAKLARGRDLGADDTINYRTTPDWDRVVKELTGGVGCDLVVELGGAETLPKAIRAVKAGGRVALIGVLSGAAATIALPLVVMRQVRLQGIAVGSADGFRAMARAMALHGTRPVIDRVFPFAEAAEALALAHAGGHFGKLVIRH